jgi:hypothetical protein
MSVEPGGTSARRGRPRTTGQLHCDRCDRGCAKIAVHWPDGAICGICYRIATNTTGVCSECFVYRLLRGLNELGELVCVDCAGIAQNFDCSVCGLERVRFRKRTCAECSVRDDLNKFLGIGEKGSPPLVILREQLLRGDRPESIYTWLRNGKVREALALMGASTFEFTHESVDELPGGRHINHLRAILTESGVLPHRDETLQRFELWLGAQLEPLSRDVRRPVERFATWHHLRSIRRDSFDTTDSLPAVHNARQEIVAAIRFVAWLKSERGRPLSECRQADVDLWLSSGPSTRYNVGQFLITSARERLAPPLAIPHRPAQSSRRLAHKDRIEWIRRCLQGEGGTLATSTAALLLLLYAQPLVRICALTLDAISEADGELFITFVDFPVWVPGPFALQIRRHLEHRSRFRTRPADTNPYLFPGGRAGSHVTSSYLMDKIRSLGINLLAAKNRSLSDLVTEMPAPIVADALGYSYQITAKYAALAAETYSRYVSSWTLTDLQNFEGPFDDSSDHSPTRHLPMRDTPQAP